MAKAVSAAQAQAAKEAAKAVAAARAEAETAAAETAEAAVCEARAAATEEITRRLEGQHASELAQVQIIAAEAAEAASSSSVKEHELAIRVRLHIIRNE